MSYAREMDDQTLRYKLEIPLIEKDYGSNAAEVLETCALVAEYAREHTPDQIKAWPLYPSDAADEKRGVDFRVRLDVEKKKATRVIWMQTGQTTQREETES